MLKIDEEKCIGCGACEAECPGMIHEDGFRKCVVYENGRYVINCKECNGCGNCLKICPVSAIEETQQI